MSKEGTNGRSNQLKGRLFESKVAKKLNKIGFNVTYSTRGSDEDRAKIDIVNNAGSNTIFPYNIQCKTLAKHCDYTKLLEEMPKNAEVNVLIHRKTKKIETGEFIKQGTYAIMKADDFYDLIAELEARKL